MIPTKKRIPREKRIENAMLNCYRELFANSTPKGDFDKLMEEAELNEFGQKVIPFMDYECEAEVLEEILDSVMKEFKVPVLIPTVSVFPVKSLEISSIIKFLSDVFPGSNLLENNLPWNDEFTCKLSCPIFPYGGSVK